MGKNKENHNIVRISDGLGNQLFQYAFGYGLYRKTGRKLIIDPIYKNKYRQYQLGCFKIDFSKRLVGEKTNKLLRLGARGGYGWLMEYREYKLKNENVEIVRESKPKKFDKGIYLNDSAYYIGYWQSFKYFDEYYDDIKRQFQPKYGLSRQGKKYLSKIENDCMNGIESVSVHVRRTDYNKVEDNACLGRHFYESALESMRSKTGKNSLYIFTDDKDFVRENFHFADYTLIEGISDLEEFVLMQKCKNHIIANSTYSWWGAYLAQNRGGWYTLRWQMYGQKIFTCRNGIRLKHI